MQTTTQLPQLSPVQRFAMKHHGYILQCHNDDGSVTIGLYCRDRAGRLSIESTRCRTIQEVRDVMGY